MIAAISHINVVVNDSIDMGTTYYEETLGCMPAYNTDGKMEYRNITNYGFCLDAGFDEGACRVDIVFLKHEVLNLYLELFYYYDPYQGNLQLPTFETNDVGGIRHLAVEVEDAVSTYNELKAMDHQGRCITQETPVPLDSFPYTFFYWVDKYRTQWEFEQGRPVEYYSIAGITG
jgi:catechol 2,3-dioxygenase-like lactoylglutathione lyase family enzyme